MAQAGRRHRRRGRRRGRDLHRQGGRRGVRSRRGRADQDPGRGRRDRDRGPGAGRDRGRRAAGRRRARVRRGRSAGSGEIVDVAIPEMGDSVAEGTILEWLVKPGDKVAKDDPLVEMSTDKVDAELPAPVAGHRDRAAGRARRDRGRGHRGLPDRGGRGRPERAAAPAADASRDAEAPRRRGNGDANATPVAARMAAEHGRRHREAERHRPARPRDQGRRRGRARRATGPASPRRGARDRRDQADPRPRRHARPLHGREPLDPHRHQLPHPARRRRCGPTAPSSRPPARSSPSPT